MMKPVSTPSPRGKRKQNASINGRSFEGRSVAKRTRSNSTVLGMEERNVLKRSTRSSSNDAFFELPYYKPLPKRQASDKGIVQSARRNKRSSTVSTSSSELFLDTAPVVTIMKRKTRSCGLNHSDLIEEENFLELNACEESESNKRNIDPNHEEKSSQLKQVQIKVKSEPACQLPVNGAAKEEINIDASNSKTINRNNSECLLMENGLSNNGPLVQNGTVVDSFHDTNTNNLSTQRSGSIFGTSVNQMMSDRAKGSVAPKFSLLSRRKRHLSENCKGMNNNHRVRRLSERGEMASVIELVFNHKKPVANKSSLSPKTCNDYQTQSKGPCSLNTVSPASGTEVKDLDVSGEKARCDCTEKRKTLHSPAKFLSNSSNCAVEISKCDTRGCSQQTETSLSEIRPLDVSHEDQQLICESEKGQQITDNSASHELNLSSPPAACTLDQDIYDESLEKVTSDDASSPEDKFVKWRRRTLRSSGIVCQPDFYALSLDLMVHRSRRKSKPSARDEKSISDAEDQNAVKSNSEKISEDRSVTAPSSDTDHDESLLSKEEKSSTNQDDATSQLNSSLNVESGTLPDTQKASDSATCKVSPTYARGRGKGRSRGRGRGRVDFTPHVIPTSPKDPLEPPPLFLEDPPSGPDVYYFESDHVALKHNQDYHSVLRVAAMLESLRQQAIKDLDVLDAKLQEALGDPIAFVDKLQKQEDLGLPKSQQIPELPQVDWSKYVSQFGTFDHVFSTAPTASKPLTRRKRINFGTSVSSSSRGASTAGPSNAADASKVRSQTFKKSWTVEEQRKLEELLIKHPQEAIEFNRYRKIASDLGGRTPLQVQSRVQKYFIKLAKAGLPIPGRMPRMDKWQSLKPKRGSSKHKSHPQTALTRISTFFADFHVPVKMRDDDDDLPDAGPRDDEDEQGWGAMNSEQVSDEEDIQDELRYSDEYLEILRLKRQRKEMLHMFDRNGRQVLAQHHGYQCDICCREPIEGIRYHCLDCPAQESVDLCQFCIRNKDMFQTAIHKLNHRFDPIHAAMTTVDVNENNKDAISYLGSPRPYADVDYTSNARRPGEYNYLDPNYLPPTG